MRFRRLTRRDAGGFQCADGCTEEMGRGKNRLIITELPYMTNKASLVERIADLVRDGNLDGIVDLRDESDRQGMRIVIELSKSADPDKVLLDLFKRTPLQSTFGIALLAGGWRTSLAVTQTGFESLP
jgi:DNA gyrase/topoisomerase IV subunit A